jgi:hypothetical protein
MACEDAIESNHRAIIEFAPVGSVSCEDIIDFALGLVSLVSLVAIGNLAELAKGGSRFNLVDEMAARGFVRGHEYYLLAWLIEPQSHVQRQLIVVVN